MKRYLTCIGVAALLSACTQVQSLRNARAAGYYVGTESVNDVADCVSGAWSTKTLHMQVVALSGGKSIQLDADGSVVALVDVLATGPTTTAKYYSKPGVGSAYSNKVMECMHATASIE